MTRTISNVCAIAKREILAFFVSPVAYFVITGFIILSGYFFFSLLSIFNAIVQQYAAMPYHPPGMNTPNNSVELRHT